MTEYARLQVIRLSNYKLEVENTEKLNSDINSAFTEINTELKKDDSLVASDLFDVDKKIEELKKSRKKWASGDIVNMTSKINISSLNINFNPTIFTYTYYATGYNDSRASYRGVVIMCDDLKNGLHTIERSGKKTSIKDDYNKPLSGNISDEYIPNGHSGIETIKSLKWLAFE